MNAKLAIMMAGTLVSKAAGLFREMLFAASFGTGPTAAAFRIAQSAYLLPVQALVGDSLGAGLLPLYKKMQRDGDGSETILLLVASIFAVMVSLVLTITLVLFASSVIHLIAPGINEVVLSVAKGFLKVLGISVPFYMLGNMFSYIEAAHGRYNAIAWRPLLLNVGSIAGVLLSVALKQDGWLVVGIVATHIAFFIWTVIKLRGLGLAIPGRAQFATIGPIGSRFFKSLVPLLGLPLVAQLNVLVERIISSHLGTVAIPAIDYSRFVCDTAVQTFAVPLGIFTMSAYAGQSSEQLKAHVSATIATIITIAVPAGVFLSVNAESATRVLFQRGHFDEVSVQVTAGVLRWMACGLGATIGAYYLVKALNAQLRNKESLVVISIACMVNMLINFTLQDYMGVEAIGLGVLGYSIVLFILCVRSLRLLPEILSLGSFLLIVTFTELVACYAINYFVSQPPIVLLFVNGGCSLIIWLIMIKIFPKARLAVAGLLERVPLLAALI